MLSNKARVLIDQLESQLRALPPDEREVVLKRMISHVNTLNEEVESLLKTLEQTRLSEYEKMEGRREDIEDEIHDYK